MASFTIVTSDTDRYNLKSPNPWATGIDPEESLRIWYAEHIAPWLDQLPLIEQDILRLRFHDRITQRAIGLLLDMSQEGITFAERRALTRIQILMARPVIDCEEMYADLGGVLTAEQLKVAWLMYTLAHYTRTGKHFDPPMHEGRVRYRLMKILTRLRKLARINPTKYGRYLEALVFTSQHLGRLTLTPSHTWQHKPPVSVIDGVSGKPLPYPRWALDQPDGQTGLLQPQGPEKGNERPKFHATNEPLGR